MPALVDRNGLQKLLERGAQLVEVLSAKEYELVDTERVVLGLVGTEVLRVDATTPVEQVMQPTPVTFRPNVDVDRMPDY